MYFSLSLAQNELLKKEEYYDNTSINNICFSVEINKQVTIDKLNEVLNESVKYYSSLRIRIKRTCEGVYQYYSEFYERKYPVFKFKNRDEYVKWNEEIRDKGIFAYNADLYKYYIVYISNEDKFVLFIIINHLIGDAISTYNLVKYITDIMDENGKFYVDDYKYVDWVEKEKKYVQSEMLKKDYEYWKKLVEDYEGKELLSINSMDILEGQRYSVFFLDDLTDKVKLFCKENALTLPCFFNAVAALLLFCKLYDAVSSILF